MRQMTIGRQVTAGFAGCLAVLLLMAAVATAAMNSVAADKDTVISQRAPLVANAHEAEALVALKAVSIRGFVLTGDEGELAKMQNYDDQLQALLTSMVAGDIAEQEALLATIGASDEEWDTAAAGLIKERRAAGSADAVGPHVEATLFPAYGKVASGLETLVDEETTSIARAVAESDSHQRTALLVLWGLAGLALISAAALAGWITRRISRQLTTVALGIDAAAREIHAGVQHQVAGATEQAAAIQQTAATVDELVQTAEQAMERAQDVSSRARHSVLVAAQGDSAVSDSTAGMLDIREQVHAIARRILELSQRAQTIGDIVDTVESIAAETHLLALNAAIEAARAGEHGRGFSVVASEVKNLADQSRAATAKVSSILAEIEQSTSAAVLATEAGTKSTEVGAGLLEQTGQTIRELADTISTAALAAEQIAASSRQQAAATVQISQAMRNVDMVMEQNVTAARQSEQTASSLTEAARQMKLLVGAS